MQISSFDYTKANGDTSKRDVLVISDPSALMFGIDISEIAPEELPNFIDEYRSVLDAKQEELAKIMGKYDLTNRFRKFEPTRMANITKVIL